LLNAIFASELTSNTTTPKDPLGALRYEYDATNGGYKVYKYVKSFDSAVANGTPLGMVNAAADATGVYGWLVTSDISDSHQNTPAGVGVGTITSGNYGWIQVGGYHGAVIMNNDDDGAVGMTVILSSADGVADTVAAGTASTHKPLGIAVGAVVAASNTMPVFLTCV
jgi:hypothetical protein